MKSKLPKGEWKLWSEQQPTEVGWYWLAGWFKEHPFRIEEPTIWEFERREYLDRDPQSILGYDKTALMWSGPIPVPDFQDGGEISV